MIAGGELARFMLALKVVLSADGSVPTLIFDEVDSGVSGAVSAAVGERLARLGEELQVAERDHRRPRMLSGARITDQARAAADQLVGAQPS